MSGLFGLDEEGNNAQREAMAGHLISPDQVRPGFFAGIPTAVGEVPFQAAGVAAQLAELVGVIPTTIVGSLLSPQTDVAQKYFETFDPYVKGWNDYFAPNPVETGTAAKIIGGFGKTAALLAAGGGNPALLIASAGAEGSMGLGAQGVNPDVAALGGTLDAAATAVGFKVPFLGSTLPMRMASGAAGFAATNVATVEAQKQLLLATGYANLAAAYQPFDATDRATDLLVGGLFGAVHHFGARNLTAPVRDAALALGNAHHWQIDAAPGIPLDLTTSAAHEETIKQAMGQLLRDEPVSVPETMSEASFQPKPPTLALEDVPAELKQVDANRAAAAPAAEPAPIVEPVAASEGGAVVTPSFPEIPAAASLHPVQQAVLRELYGLAHASKSAFDGVLTGIAQAVGAKVKLADIKGSVRAVEKIKGDYSGDASRIKDLVRGTLEVRTIGEAMGAIERLKAAGGMVVLDSGQRNLLDPAVPTPIDGYRDAKFNVRMPNGAIAEVQVNLGPLLEAKAIGHSLYIERAAIDRAAHGREMTPEEGARIDDLNGLMRALYEPVWERLMSEAKASGDTAAPLRLAESNGNRLGVASSNASEASPPSGIGTNATGMPSTSQSTEPLGSAAGSTLGTGTDTGRPPNEPILAQRGDFVLTSAGRRVPVKPKIVEASSLITSDQPAFPQELQPRQRADRAALSAQVQAMATNLQPDLLGHSTLADTGAPITGPDNVVESGNGRVMALRQVYANLPRQAESYRRMLADLGYDTTGFKEPVLVRERTTQMTPEERQAFTTEANQSGVAAMSPVERAQNDARLLDATAMSKLAGEDLTTVKNAAFVRNFLDGLPVAERNQLVDSKGVLSKEGVRRLQAAILAKAYGGTPESNQTLGRLLESTGEEIKGPLAALQDAAPAFAKLRQMIEDGKVGPEYDVAPAVLQAVEDVIKIKRSGGSLAEHLGTQDMFAPTSLLSKAFFDETGTRLVSREKAGAALNRYASQAMHERLDQSSIFSGGPTAPAEILQRAAAPQTSDMFGLRTAQGGAESVTPPEPVVLMAAALVNDHPNLRVSTGNVNPDGSIETLSAADAMKIAQDDIAAAEQHAKAFSAAVDCAAQRGVQ